MGDPVRGNGGTAPGNETTNRSAVRQAGVMRIGGAVSPSGARGNVVTVRPVPARASPARIVPARIGSAAAPADLGGMDQRALGRFFERFPTLRAFDAAYPELRNVALPRFDGAVFADMLRRIGEEGGGRTCRNLLDAFDPVTLLIGLKELRSRDRRSGRPLAVDRTRQRPVCDMLAGDRYATRGREAGYDPTTLRPYKTSIESAAGFLEEQNPKLCDVLHHEFGRSKIDVPILEILSARYEDLLPSGQGILKVNEERANYFRQLFQVEYSARVLLACIRELTADEKPETQADINRIAVSTGDKLYREILLSLIRTEIASLDFGRRRPFDRILMRGLQALYATGNVDKALTAVHNERLEARPGRPAGVVMDLEVSRETKSNELRRLLDDFGRHHKAFRSEMMPTSILQFVEATMDDYQIDTQERPYAAACEVLDYVCLADVAG